MICIAVSAQAGLQFYQSKDKTLQTSGDKDGFVRPEFFLQVWTVNPNTFQIADELPIKLPKESVEKKLAEAAAVTSDIPVVRVARPERKGAEFAAMKPDG